MKDKKITEKEYQELLGLEYVLTWGYSEIGEKENDEKRHKELSNKSWASKEWNKA